MRALKFLVGLLLLPLCYVAAHTFVDLLDALKPDSLDAVSFEAWSLAGGFGFWLFFWLATPAPIRAYVLGHELTHALWAMVLGARVSGLDVSERGGSIRLSKTNFLITLAPYFFPFYTACVIAGYGAISLFVDLSIYRPYVLALVGLSWGFHLTFTLRALLQRQPDIEANGHLFSYAVIFLLNLLGLCLGIVLAASPTWSQWVSSWQAHGGELQRQIMEWTARQSP